MTPTNPILIACSPQGRQMAEQLRQHPDWAACPIWIPQRYCTEGDTAVQGYAGLAQLVQQIFSQTDCLVFFCACGIAVRMIAPLLHSKSTDPAVIVCDEGGLFAISLLSGHMGGANSFTAQIADVLHAQPIITTATDIQQVFAVDSWAKAQQLHLVEKQLIKEISARLLQGKFIGFASDYPWQGDLPQGIQLNSDCPWGICVSAANKQPFAHTLHLVPQNLVLGVGCRKGITAEQLEQALQHLITMYALDANRIGTMATIDLKQQEAGLLAWAAQKKCPLLFYTADQLHQAEGNFTPSAFVQHITGVENVCERSAALASNHGKALLAKQKLNGITMAVYEKNITLTF